jgi:hypothetical protein
MLILKNKIDYKRPLFKTIMWGSIITATAYVLTSGLVAINGWSYTHQIVNPFQFSFKTRSIIQSREPLKVLSPVVKEVMNDNESNLTEIEKKILAKWGLGEFKVARAISKCESNMNPEAVNWGSKDVGVMQINLPIWSKPVKDKFGYTLKDLFDTDKNIEVAYWIWDRGNGIENDNIGSWNPWVAKQTTCFVAEL